LIKEQGGTFGLSSMPLYTDRVILDFDDAPEDYERSVAYCLKQDWDFDAYLTGNRGHHIHIYVVPYSEPGVHIRSATWASAHFKGYDDTMFKCSGVTRIPGTHHSKTGRKMVRVDGSRSGVTPDIRDAKLSIPTVAHNLGEDTNEDRRVIFSLMLNKRIRKGGRNEYAFKLAACGLDSGVDPKDLQMLLEYWAVTNARPIMSATEVKTIVDSAQKGRRMA
jgi:hypothetical protein